MPELIDAMGAALTGRDEPDVGLSFGRLIDRLADAAGSAAAAARLIGVSPTTFYRWRRGRQQPKVGSEIVRKELRKREVKPGLVADIKAKHKTLWIVGTVTVSNDTRPNRKCNVGKDIPKQTMSKILNRWFSGDDVGANRMLWNAIDKHYVEGIDIEQISYCEFK